MRKLKIPLSPLFLIAVLALAIAIGSFSLQLSLDGRGDSSSSELVLPEGSPLELAKVFEVWSTLDKFHIQRDSLDPNVLTEGAIRGMLEALDDPYASYLDPQRYALDFQDFKGQFEGIGAEVTMRNGEITIVAPIADTPADKAGVRPGDVILEVDGESTDGYTLLDAISKIRGLKGEPVNLVIRRLTTSEPISLTIVRDVIQVRSVKLRMLVGQIAHLRVTSFTETTGKELREFLDNILKLGAHGVILDVRNNPGGLLESVVDVTSQFIDSGLVLYEVDGQGKRRDWKTRSGGIAKDMPLVLLVNEFSASGSEVLAGAFLDHERGPVIGNKTFGKGSVNSLRRLSDGSGIYVTIARWYTPKGNLIEGQGLEPDVEVTQPDEDGEDLQLDKAIELLKGLIDSGES